MDGTPAATIRNAVIHLLNEQPLLADLFELPGPADVALRCTNLRTMSGNRPVFVDRSESVFVFPFAQIRFVEIPPSAVGPGASGTEAEAAAAATTGPEPAEPEADLELDEDFLRRIREV